jgi:hypothetical protein
VLFLVAMFSSSLPAHIMGGKTPTRRLDHQPGSGHTLYVSRGGGMGCRQVRIFFSPGRRHVTVSHSLPAPIPGVTTKWMAL